MRWDEKAMAEKRVGPGGILRLRNLAMIENIRRAEDPTWRERLDHTQVVTRLGRMFRGAENPLQAMLDHAAALKEELRRQPSHWPTPKGRDEPGG